MSCISATRCLVSGRGSGPRIPPSQSPTALQAVAVKQSILSHLVANSDMASSPASDISLASSVFGSSVSDASPRIRHYPSSSLPRPNSNLPRLTSPRIFRDFFANTITTDTTSRTLPPARFQETSQDFTGALADASRAVQNAQQALQLPPIVDLTESSPSQSPESHFISRTTHPHDARLRQTPQILVAQPLHQPVYGHHPHSRPTPAISADMARQPHSPTWIPPPPLRSTATVRIGPIAGSFRGPDFVDYAPRPPTHDEIRREESRAIQRQRNARLLWQQNERNRTRQAPQQSPNHKPKHHSKSPEFEVESPEIESVDLTQLDENSTLADALSKQRSDAISSQKSEFDTITGRSALTSYKCPICMETPKDATTTICGHLFCHRCIIDTLKWSEEQRRADQGHHGKALGVCPVCRKALQRKDKAGSGRTLIPVEVKLITRRRKKAGGKGKERARDGSEVVDLEKLEMLKEQERARSAEMWSQLTEAGEWE